MLPILGVIAATVGLLTIIFLIRREVGSEAGPLESNALLGTGALAVAVCVWYVVTHLPSGGGGH
jgi:hypothetical protein